MGADAFIEPIVVASILTAGVFVNRRRKDISIIQSFWKDPYGDHLWSSPSATNLLSPSLTTPTMEPQWRERMFFGWTMRSRNTSMWRDTAVSRFLAKFPFVLEVWYWLLVYWVGYFRFPTARCGGWRCA